MYIIRDNAQGVAFGDFFYLRERDGEIAWTQDRWKASEFYDEKDAKNWLARVRVKSPTAKLLRRKFECSRDDCTHDFDDCPTCELCGMDAMEYEQRLIKKRDDAEARAERLRVLLIKALPHVHTGHLGGISVLEDEIRAELGNRT